MVCSGCINDGDDFSGRETQAQPSFEAVAFDGGFCGVVRLPGEARAAFRGPRRDSAAAAVLDVRDWYRDRGVPFQEKRKRTDGEHDQSAQ